MSDELALPDLLKRLDLWRHFPDYQLERRVDALISFYLKGFLEQTFGQPLVDLVIPEFPIQRSLVNVVVEGQQSVKVDFALFSADRKIVHFVELKTDRKSRNKTQDLYMQKVSRLQFHQIVQGIIEIVQKTKERRKYYYLLDCLAGLGFLTCPPGVIDHLNPSVRRGLGAQLRRIAATAHDAVICVTYVEPVAMTDELGARSLGFSSLIAYLNSLPDNSARVLACYLDRWIVAPGAHAPQPLQLER